MVQVGQDSIVGIATCWTVRGLNPIGGWDFLHLSWLALGPTQPPIQRVPVLSQRNSSRGAALTTHPYLAPRLKKD